MGGGLGRGVGEEEGLSHPDGKSHLEGQQYAGNADNPAHGLIERRHGFTLREEVKKKSRYISSGQHEPRSTRCESTVAL